MEPLCSSWSHFGGICRQKLTSSLVNRHLKYPHEGPCVDDLVHWVQIEMPNLRSSFLKPHTSTSTLDPDATPVGYAASRAVAGKLGRVQRLFFIIFTRIVSMDRLRVTFWSNFRFLIFPSLKLASVPATAVRQQFQSLGFLVRGESVYRPPHSTPCTLEPSPYSPNPTPFTLHHSPYSLNPSPSTLHPTH